MKRINYAKLKDDNLIFVDSKENKNFYFQLIDGILFSLYDDKILNEIQYELCKKELDNKKRNL